MVIFVLVLLCVFICYFIMGGCVGVIGKPTVSSSELSDCWLLVDFVTGGLEVPSFREGTGVIFGCWAEI